MLRDVPNGCTLAVRVHPGARRNAIGGFHAGAIKIALTAPAVDGRANEALIAFLAERLRLPRSRVRLLAGQTNRTKTMLIEGLNKAEVENCINSDLG